MKKHLNYAMLDYKMKKVYKGKKHKITASYMNCMLRILIVAGKKGVQQTRIG